MSVRKWRITVYFQHGFTVRRQVCDRVHTETEVNLFFEGVLAATGTLVCRYTLI